MTSIDPELRLHRIIQQANQATICDDRYITPVAIKFTTDSNGNPITISEKHANLYVALRKIDDTVKFINMDNVIYDDPSNIPQDESYIEHFPLDITHRKDRCIYVQCKLNSKIPLNKFKHGERNIMQFLREHKIFLNPRKFEKSQEARVGFFPNIHPDHHLRGELRDHLEHLLKTVPLSKEAHNELLQQEESDDPMEDDNSFLQIPAFDITPATIGFGNGPERITTKAFELRCDPSNAAILKTLFTTIANNSTSELKFIPHGIIQLLGPETYKRTLNEQNCFLNNYVHFTLYNLLPPQMSLIRQQLKQHPSIKEVVRTLNSTKDGKWFVVTTKQQIKQAQQHVDNTLLQYEQELTVDDNTIGKPMRINPTINQTNFINLATKIQNDTARITTTYKTPPRISNPIMASYNLPSDKTSYSEATKKTTSTPVIQPTYTEIDWKTEVEKVRKDTIDECTRITQDLIAAAEIKQRNMVNEITKQIDDKISNAITHSSAQISQTILSQLVPFLTMDPTTQQRQIIPHNTTPTSQPINHVPTNLPLPTQTIQTTTVPTTQGVTPSSNNPKDNESSEIPTEKNEDPHSKKLKISQTNHDLSEGEDNLTDV